MTLRELLATQDVKAEDLFDIDLGKGPMYGTTVSAQWQWDHHTGNVVEIEIRIERP